MKDFQAAIKEQILEMKIGLEKQIASAKNQAQAAELKAEVAEKQFATAEEKISKFAEMCKEKISNVKEEFEERISSLELKRKENFLSGNGMLLSEKNHEKNVSSGYPCSQI